jgi:hypothetical protein
MRSSRTGFQASPGQITAPTSETPEVADRLGDSKRHTRASPVEEIATSTFVAGILVENDHTRPSCWHVSRPGARADRQSYRIDRAHFPARQ